MQVSLTVAAKDKLNHKARAMATSTYVHNLEQGTSSKSSGRDRATSFESQGGIVEGCN